MKTLYCLALWAVCLFSNHFVSATEISFDYDVYLRNYYRDNTATKQLTAESHNGFTEAYLNNSSYNGGSVFSLNDTDENYQLVAAFGLSSYTPAFENWTENEVIGSLTVKASAANPAGSLVPVEIYYEYANIFNTIDYISCGLSLWTDYYTNEVYSVSGQIASTNQINLVVGQVYDFYTWFSAGCSFVPIDERYLAGVLFKTTVVPEPMTLGLLGLGVILAHLKNNKYKF